MSTRKYRWYPAFWRDIDSEKAIVGARVWWLGGQFYFGRKMYVVRLMVRS